MVIIIEGTVYKISYKHFLLLRELIEENKDNPNGDSLILNFIDTNKPIWKEIGAISLDWRL